MVNNVFSDIFSVRAKLVIAGFVVSLKSKMGSYCVVWRRSDWRAMNGRCVMHNFFSSGKKSGRVPTSVDVINVRSALCGKARAQTERSRLLSTLYLLASRYASLLSRGRQDAILYRRSQSVNPCITATC